MVDISTTNVMEMAAEIIKQPEGLPTTTIAAMLLLLCADRDKLLAGVRLRHQSSP